MYPAEPFRTVCRSLHSSAFYFSGPNNDWTAPQNDNVWRDAVKTLFDPCPAGWRVPKGGADELSPWFNFSLPGTVTPNANPVTFTAGPSGGHNFHRYGTSGTTTWYPASGWRSPNSGLMLNPGTDGAYWTATYTGFQSYLLFFTPTVTDPDNIGYTYRARGYPVRCVRE